MTWRTKIRQTCNLLRPWWGTWHDPLVREGGKQRLISLAPQEITAISGLWKQQSARSLSISTLLDVSSQFLVHPSCYQIRNWKLLSLDDQNISETGWISVQRCTSSTRGNQGGGGRRCPILKTVLQGARKNEQKCSINSPEVYTTGQAAKHKGSQYCCTSTW